MKNIKQVGLMTPWVILFANLSYSENLLSDPGFKNADPTANVADGWRWDPIRLPSNIELGENSATLTGKKGFFRSPLFSTREDAAISYKVSSKGSGRGMGRVEAIWWTADGQTTAPHTETVIEDTVLSAKAAIIEGAAHPSGTAARGQIRFVQHAEEGNGILQLGNPTVEAIPRRFEPGILLLHLDAAEPGGSPESEWVDLSGKNQPVKAIGSPMHDAAAGIYRINSRADYFKGAAADASRFDFDTARALGHKNPFTIVAYASLDGPAAGIFMNKLEIRKLDPDAGAMVDAPGWIYTLGWDEFNNRRIEFHQMLDNMHQRNISRHGGDNGMKANLTAGQMHLIVLHVPGDGVAGNIQAYIDGSREVESNVPWNGGTLPKKSIVNEAPLQIGGGLHVHGLLGEQPLFDGTIGFIEIWSGRGLLEGMSPQAYGKHRWNGGNPKRGRVEQTSTARSAE